MNRYAIYITLISILVQNASKKKVLFPVLVSQSSRNSDKFFSYEIRWKKIRFNLYFKPIMFVKLPQKIDRK